MIAVRLHTYYFVFLLFSLLIHVWTMCVCVCYWFYFVTLLLVSMATILSLHASIFCRPEDAGNHYLRSKSPLMRRKRQKVCRMLYFRISGVGVHKPYTLSEKAETGQTLSVGTGAREPRRPSTLPAL
jgi:hypothetical protein